MSLMEMGFLKAVQGVVEFHRHWHKRMNARFGIYLLDAQKVTANDSISSVNQ